MIPIFSTAANYGLAIEQEVSRKKIEGERALAGTEDGVPFTAGSRYFGGGAGGATQTVMPAMSIESINLGQEMQQYNLGQQRQEFEKQKIYDRNPVLARLAQREQQGFQPTSPSISTGFQPTDFQPQMDALRSGIMGRMSQQLGIALPKIGQPYKPPKPTPYWQQAGMNPPKFPTY